MYSCALDGMCLPKNMHLSITVDAFLCTMPGLFKTTAWSSHFQDGVAINGSKYPQLLASSTALANNN